MGMLESLPGIPDAVIWDDHKFDVADVALCGALIHPNGSGPELNLTACWLVWGTYADDYFPALYGNNRNMAGAKVFNARLSAFMPLDDSTPSEVPTNPVEAGSGRYLVSHSWSHVCQRADSVPPRNPGYD